ncbi:MAG: hypothetical protein ACPGYX_05175 [Oceanobacter sp.]
MSDQQALALDMLAEALNLGLGNVIDELSDIASSRIQLHVPEVRIIPRNTAINMAIDSRDEGGAVFVQQSFYGEISGEALVCFSEAESLNLLNSLSSSNDESHIEFSETEEEMLLDLTNVAVSGVIYAMSSLLEMKLTADLPRCEYGLFRDIRQSSLLSSDDQESVLFLTICFTVVNRNSTAQLMFFQNRESLDRLYERVDQKLQKMLLGLGS